jgi:hypothetical protein
VKTYIPSSAFPSLPPSRLESDTLFDGLT